MGRHAITLEHPVSFVKVCRDSEMRCAARRANTLFSKSVLALEVIYVASITLTKISVLCLYRRLFPSRRFKYALWVAGTFIICNGITASLVNIFQCVPVSSDWNPTIKPRCINYGLDLIILSSVNVITDAVTLCLPIYQIWHLRMSRTLKLQIGGLFLLGGL